MCAPPIAYFFFGRAGSSRLLVITHTHTGLPIIMQSAARLLRKCPCGRVLVVYLLTAERGEERRRPESNQRTTPHHEHPRTHTCGIITRAAHGTEEQSARRSDTNCELASARQRRDEAPVTGERHLGLRDRWERMRSHEDRGLVAGDFEVGEWNLTCFLIM